MSSLLLRVYNGPWGLVRALGLLLTIFVILPHPPFSPPRAGGASFSRSVSEFNNGDSFWYLWVSRPLCTMHRGQVLVSIFDERIRDGRKEHIEE